MEFGARMLALLALFTGLASVAPAAQSAASRPELRSIRLEPGDSATQIVLDLSAPAPYRLFLLEAPHRAVLDLPSARSARGLRAPEAGGLARGLRAGPREHGGLRLVVELPSGASARAARAAPSGARGHRIVLNLAARAAPASATAAPPVRQQPDRPIRPAHAPPDSGREVIVAVDAGHGGNDPGAIGPSGTREKDAVLAIARELASRINQEPGMRAVLTRDGDYFLTLRQRIVRARASKADMFVSVHADSVRDRGVSGASVYVLSEKGATDEQARWLAERENAADLKGGVSLDDKDNTLASVLLDLTQSASISASMVAAERVLRSIDRVGVVRKPRVQQAGFVVLKSPDIPSMLVETAYISNPADERRLREDEHRADLARAIFAGVRGYFEEHPPEGTRFAMARRNALPPTAQLGP
jgi:N-acetylmuramoyl-L-alanine amidase